MGAEALDGMSAELKGCWFRLRYGAGRAAELVALSCIFVSTLFDIDGTRRDMWAVWFNSMDQRLYIALVGMPFGVSMI